MKVFATVIGKTHFVTKGEGEDKYSFIVSLSEFDKVFGFSDLAFYRVSVDEELYQSVDIFDEGFVSVVEYMKDNRSQKIVQSFYPAITK